MPWTGGLFAAGLLALIGLPPFGLFVAELALFQAGFSQEYQWLMVIVIVLVTIVFISLVNHLHKLLYGPPPEGITLGERFNWRNGLLMLNLGVLTVLGIALPVPLVTLLNQIVGTLSR
jgi:hydrogenase-4 component F